MIRAVWFLILVALISLAAAVVADNPGAVSLEWLGYKVDTSIGVLLAVVFLISVCLAIVFRVWFYIRNAPKRVGKARRDWRRERGYKALTQGMVAIAAGDAQEARRQARKAENLLAEPPLTMLLSAQAAQLNGDDRAAERFFRAMTENEETEFLGLRGLLNQATKRGDQAEALSLTRRAHRLNANSDWVSESLFDLQVQAGQWLDAHVTVKEAVRNKHLDPADGKRRQAVLTYQMSLDAARGGDRDRALEYARDSLNMDPGFVPAALSVAGTLISVGKNRKAASMIERIWARTPHPHMVALYLEARGATDALDRVKAAEKLRATNAGDVESDLAVAGEALAANLWGKARDHLMAAGGDNPPARVCRMLAELEEAEHQDLGKARQWLVKASMADPDPAWVCGNCGHTVTNWSASCGNCGGFDRFTWRTPAHVMQLAGATTSGDAVMLAGANDPTDHTMDGDALPVVSLSDIKPPAPAEG